MSNLNTQEALPLHAERKYYTQPPLDREQLIAVEDADAKLAAMGYKHELTRSLSLFSILGLSIAIMAVPAGVSVTLSIGLTDGGPVTIVYGWVLVTLISLCIATSLAEICSVYPTSGGPYYWSAILANKKWAPVTSWITGWLNLVGNWAGTASVCFSVAGLIVSGIELGDVTYVPSAWHVVLIYWIVLLIVSLVNIFLVKRLDLINTICVYWTVASVVIILVTVLTLAKGGRRSAAYVFTEFDATRAGWPPGWAFAVGLLQAAYAFAGYGMVPAMCEEVQSPEKQVPKAMVLSVVVAGLTGLGYLIGILFVMPDVSKMLSVPTGQSIGYLFKTATGSAAGGVSLLFFIIAIQCFSGIGALTVASRCLYAFSRDGAVPGSQAWAKVNKRYDVPLSALLFSLTIDGLLGLLYPGSSTAFNAFVSTATICLSASYAVPIFILLVRGRHLVEGASFHLGKFGYILNTIAVLSTVLFFVLFTMPTAIPVTAATMNYAVVLCVAFAAISVLWYLLWGRKYFTGPPVSSPD